MAANLLRAGHRVTVWNRTRVREKPLLDLGARAGGTVADACGGDAVVTMLADDAAVEAVALGPDAIVATLRPGAVHVSMSTIGIATAERLTAAHRDAGQRFVAAPVFGRPEAAASAKLHVVAAGAPDAVDACRPLLDAMGQSLFRVGSEPRVANLVKLSGNFLIAATIEALGEAMALVAKAGVDRRQYLDLLTSTLFTAPLYRSYGGMIAEERFEPAGFAARLGAKDIRLALAAGDALRVPMPLAGLLRDRFLTLLARGGDVLDWSAIGRLAADDAGL